MYKKAACKMLLVKLTPYVCDEIETIRFGNFRPSDPAISSSIVVRSESVRNVLNRSTYFHPLKFDNEISLIVDSFVQ